jgi:glucose/arabinose dehydrogenase
MVSLIFAVLALGQSPEKVVREKTIPNLDVEIAFPGLKFERCVAIAHPRDGTDRLFILEQPGRVRWFENDPRVKEDHVALDIVDKVLSRGNEEGLLGIAFHPRVKSNHFVFLQYSAPKSDPNLRHNVVARFTMDKDHRKILPESEKVILTVRQPYENHNGGVLQFGPDGYLYLGLGDGGSANDPHGNGQNLKTFLGKFLRIDIDREDPEKSYAVPKDNPFVGNPDALPEIWSYGWRNPWGYHFDRKTGELWSADVGQDKWEEINIVKKGANYGWSFREGTHEFKPGGKGPFEEPIVEHGHAQPNGPPGSNSVTGGCVYRGKRLGVLDGVYLYGDYVTGHLWALRWDGKKVVEHKHLLEFKLKQITTFGEDRDGDVYFSCFTDGKLYRFKLPEK